MYVWGPTGTGKTTQTHRFLESLRKFRPDLDYYHKVGGMASKYWDGYDNQPIVWIDDPNQMDMRNDKDTVEMWKRVIGTGPALVEVKFGTMQFSGFRSGHSNAGSCGCNSVGSGGFSSAWLSV